MGEKGGGGAGRRRRRRRIGCREIILSYSIFLWNVRDDKSSSPIEKMRRDRTSEPSSAAVRFGGVIPGVFAEVYRNNSSSRVTFYRARAFARGRNFFRSKDARPPPPPSDRKISVFSDISRGSREIELESERFR